MYICVYIVLVLIVISPLWDTYICTYLCISIRISIRITNHTIFDFALYKCMHVYVYIVFYWSIEVECVLKSVCVSSLICCLNDISIKCASLLLMITPTEVVIFCLRCSCASPWPPWINGVCILPFSFCSACMVPGFRLAVWLFIDIRTGTETFSCKCRYVNIYINIVIPTILLLHNSIYIHT